MLIYERELDRNTDWAVHEGSAHFEGRSAVQKALYAVARKLDELGIPYAIAGGMAMYLHGYRRFTEDVDMLVTEDGLRRIHEQLEGRGYRPLFPGSKNLRDTEHGVRIEFLVSGQYPGDGRPKPVSFPDPEGSFVDINGIHVVNLVKLIELKLASGTAPGRRKDIGDAQEVMRALKLPLSYQEQLNPMVRPLYVELWEELQSEARQEPLPEKSIS